MSSPNEPGHPRTGDGPGSANGSSVEGGPGPQPRNGPAGDQGDVPPWQRGNRTHQPPPQRADSGSEADRAGAPATKPPGVDDRINRFMGGGPATPPQTRDSGAGPPREKVPATPRDAGQGPGREPGQAPIPSRDAAKRESEAYASELPDLSEAPPRTVQRNPGGERPAPKSPTEPSTRTQVATRSSGPVRASMQVRRFDPWSVLKVSLVLSVASFFVWMIAVAFLYLVLGGMGVWSKLNSNVGDLLTSASGSGGELVSSGTIFGGAALIGLVNIVLLTAMATCGAFIYNLTTDIVGGIEVTLADRD